jgi:hypothetical protein
MDCGRIVDRVEHRLNELAAASNYQEHLRKCIAHHNAFAIQPSDFSAAASNVMMRPVMSRLITPSRMFSRREPWIPLSAMAPTKTIQGSRMPSARKTFPPKTKEKDIPVAEFRPRNVSGRAY